MFATPKMFTRRSAVLLVVLGLFVGALLVTLGRLGRLCLDGASCGHLSQAAPYPHAPESAAEMDDSQGYEPQSVASASASIETSDKAASRAAFNEPLSKLKTDCAHFPYTSNILLVMKTGASEAYSRIPTQIMTNLKCLPEFLIFSDMEQEIAGYTIHDSLDKVLDSVKMDNEDFDIYFRQRECPVDLENCNKDDDSTSEAWQLDKYKNIHIAEKVFGMRPDYDWYLFVDADTYVVWPTMVEWLKKLDPLEPHYFGSVAKLGDFPFGHGGSGYVVSKTTMQEFFEGKTDVANRWDEATKKICCGDVMFAKGLKEATDIDVKDTWPTINGEKPFTIPYSERAWCQPIATMHHVGSEEVSELHAFERERNFSSPVRIRDLYHKFIAPRLVLSLSNWDNLSNDVYYLNASAREYNEWQLARAKVGVLTELEKQAHLSIDNCRQACEAHEQCLQYRLHQGICGMSRKIKYGAPKKLGETIDDERRSGWALDKIKQWVQDHDDCGKDIAWPLAPASRT